MTRTAHTRRRLAKSLLVLLFFGLVLPVAGQDPNPANGDALVGSWRAELSAAQALLLEIRGASVEMKLDGGGSVTPLWRGKLSFPQECPDRHFDWVELKAGDRPLPDNKCLYRLSGDTLLVIGGGPAERPTRFYCGPGTESRTLIFTRMGE